MPEPIYVPILKGREGEYAALEVLSSEVKGRVMPLIEIPEIPYDFANKRPVKTLEDYIADIPDRLKKACSAMPFYLDLSSLDQEADKGITQTMFTSTLSASLAAGSSPVPVVVRTSTPGFLSAAQTHAITTESGSCIRLTTRDFEEEVDLEAEVSRLLLSSSSDIASTDLIIDLQDIGLDPSKAAIIARYVFSLIPRKGEWRRMILAAASFPGDLSEVGAATVVKLPRHEWALWKTLQRKPNALPRRDLIFGDYAVAHPVVKALDPRTMQMSANIRYTVIDNWLIVKGRNVRRYGFDQYFDLCRTLVERPEYCGRTFSWGDKYIADCAESMQGPGNATTWRKVGVNHHLTFVTREIANPSPGV